MPCKYFILLKQLREERLCPNTISILKGHCSKTIRGRSYLCCLSVLSKKYVQCRFRRLTRRLQYRSSLKRFLRLRCLHRTWLKRLVPLRHLSVFNQSKSVTLNSNVPLRLQTYIPLLKKVYLCVCGFLFHLGDSSYPSGFAERFLMKFLISACVSPACALSL